MKFSTATIILLIFVTLLLAAFVFSFAMSISEFVQSKKYINFEIKRSSNKSERKKWLRKKRRLWLHLFFPFIK